ncbi:right-handed parallel beta-helix repeat-containing protein [Segeticoccus rhizosphaerae]|uniref:right-handed parallel beta-helix repeat-containing protein n=1 Tax=Segeticoccus rhizosphaerae TaxID=1104777 RepID=UPI00138FE204|nr:right-handed parallel beta-helix repeat-containing protein [Ornithinicoccus soli]
MAVSTALLGAIGVVGAGAAQAAPNCTPNVDNSGLSAAVVAHSHQYLANRRVDATGCDIGIFVGPGVQHVTVNDVVVTGANFQGILAYDTSYLTIKNSRIHDNGFHTLDSSAPALPGSGLHSYVGQSFGISLFGVSWSTVENNRVTDNGRGGIGVMDTGANNPGTINQNPSAPLRASTHDRVVGNTMSANYGGCGLVAATQNFGGHLSHLFLAGNRIIGTGTMSESGPDVAGIVVAADLPNSWVSDVSVVGNKVTNSFEGGVIVNAEAFNSSTRNVAVLGNTLRANNWGAQEAPDTAGVIVFANPGAEVPPGADAPKNVHTVVAGNRITEQFYGIYSVGDFPPIAFGNYIRVTSGGDPIFHG